MITELQANASFVGWIDPEEKRIISRLISLMLAEGLVIRVHDGEENATEWTTDQDAIMRQIAQTDETYLKAAFPKTDGSTGQTYIGYIFLVHGNGEDVISDVSARIEEEMKLLDAIASRAV